MPAGMMIALLSKPLSSLTVVYYKYTTECANENLFENRLQKRGGLSWDYEVFFVTYKATPDAFIYSSVRELIHYRPKLLQEKPCLMFQAGKEWPCISFYVLHLDISSSDIATIFFEFILHASSWCMLILT